MSAEVSLIDSLDFLDELEFVDQTVRHPGIGAVERQPYADAFDALDSGLPIDAAASDPLPPLHERMPIEESYELPETPPTPAERLIPFLAAALVLALCLTAGAATAAYVFNERLMHITAPPSAIR